MKLEAGYICPEWNTSYLALHNFLEKFSYVYLFIYCVHVYVSVTWCICSNQRKVSRHRFSSSTLCFLEMTRRLLGLATRTFTAELYVWPHSIKTIVYSKWHSRICHLDLDIKELSCSKKQKCLERIMRFILLQSIFWMVTCVGKYLHSGLHTTHDWRAPLA